MSRSIRVLITQSCLVLAIACFGAYLGHLTHDPQPSAGTPDLLILAGLGLVGAGVIVGSQAFVEPEESVEAVINEETALAVACGVLATPECAGEAFNR